MDYEYDTGKWYVVDPDGKNRFQVVYNNSLLDWIGVENKDIEAYKQFFGIPIKEQVKLHRQSPELMESFRQYMLHLTLVLEGNKSEK